MRVDSKICFLIGASIVTGGLLSLGVHSVDQSAANPVDQRSVREEIAQSHSPGIGTRDVETPAPFYYWPLTSDGQ